jgi:hypothetical protein
MFAINQIRQSLESENDMATTDHNKAPIKPDSVKSPPANTDQSEPKEDKDKRTAIFPGDVAPAAT